MHREITGQLGLIIIVAVAAFAAAPASADWTEDFSGGTTHNPWVIYDDTGTRPPDATAVSTSANNLQLIGNPQLAQQQIFDLFVVAVVGLNDPLYSFDEVTVRSTVFAPVGRSFAGQTTQGNNDTFVIARTQPGGTSGYVLALDFQSGEVDLVRSDNANITQLNASGNVPGFLATKSYVLELKAEGTQLTGCVLDGGAPVVTVTTTDAAFTSGWSGVGGAINDNGNIGGPGGPGRTPVTAGFDNVSSTLITHPPNVDLTQDGRVDRADLALFTSYYGTPANATELSGDFTGDGRVGLHDMILLRDAMSAPSPTAVPEPSTILVALVAAAGVLLWRRSRAKVAPASQGPLTAAAAP